MLYRTFRNIGFAFFLFFLVRITSNVFAQGFSGTICFRDGTTRDFEYMGDKEDIFDVYLHGKLGKKKVKYRFEELSEIYFLDKEKSYAEGNENWHGTVLIEHRNKEKSFTLTDCWIQVGEQTGALYFVYHDTVFNKTYESWTNILDLVSHVLIGEKTGNFKYNPATKQYFPPSFIFDPYTGEKLEWIKKK